MAATIIVGTQTGDDYESIVRSLCQLARNTGLAENEFRVDKAPLPENCKHLYCVALGLTQSGKVKWDKKIG